MAIYRPAPGLKGRLFELWVLNRWLFNFCVRSTPLRGLEEGRKDGRKEERLTLDGEQEAAGAVTLLLLCPTSARYMVEGMKEGKRRKTDP